MSKSLTGIEHSICRIKCNKTSDKILTLKPLERFPFQKRAIETETLETAKMALNLADIRAKLKSRAVWIGFTAEFLATTIFVFNVVGANLSWNGAVFSVHHTAATIGFSITVLATSIGHLTGGQINPVVSLSFITTKRIHPIDGILYICGQFLGGKL